MENTGQHIPAFFASDDDAYVLKQILQTYHDGKLPKTLTAHRDQIEEWDGVQHATEPNRRTDIS